MANNKIGLAYYNVDTDRYLDIRIKKLRKDFSCNGIAVYDYILCEIYRVKGCFIVWDESTVFDVADYFGIKESLVNEIVAYCCTVGLFNKGLLISGKILTSQSIQERYTEMCLRAKRSNYFIPENVKITEESIKIPEECDIITEEYTQTTGSLPQRKKESKEKKVKKSKEYNNVEKNWKTDFEIYQSELKAAYFSIMTNEYLIERKKYHHGLDIKMSIDKSIKDYWNTPAGWKNKKASKSNEIDWKATFNNALSLKCNQVWESKKTSTTANNSNAVEDAIKILNTK